MISYQVHFAFCQALLGSEKFCLAGGSLVSLVTDAEVKDYDCFFIDEFEYLKAVEFISYRAKEVLKRKGSRQFKTESGATIDVIYTHQENFRGVIDSFDLVHCGMYFHPKEGLVSLESAEKYARLKILQLHKITLPYHTLGRISKYKSRGYVIDSLQESMILGYCYKAPWGPGKESEYNT